MYSNILCSTISVSKKCNAYLVTRPFSLPLDAPWPPVAAEMLGWALTSWLQSAGSARRYDITISTIHTHKQVAAKHFAAVLCAAAAFREFPRCLVSFQTAAVYSYRPCEACDMRLSKRVIFVVNKKKKTRWFKKCAGGADWNAAVTGTGGERRAI